MGHSTPAGWRGADQACRPRPRSRGGQGAGPAQAAMSRGARRSAHERARLHLASGGLTRELAPSRMRGRLKPLRWSTIGAQCRRRGLRSTIARAWPVSGLRGRSRRCSPRRIDGALDSRYASMPRRSDRRAIGMPAPAGGERGGWAWSSEPFAGGVFGDFAGQVALKAQRRRCHCRGWRRANSAPRCVSARTLSPSTT